jgi:hypothetical protein
MTSVLTGGGGSDQPGTFDQAPHDLTSPQPDDIAAWRPISRLDPADGARAWQQIISLFVRNGLAPPPVRLRDELVTHLMWARYGEMLDAALLTDGAKPHATDEAKPNGPNS